MAVDGSSGVNIKKYDVPGKLNFSLHITATPNEHGETIAIYPKTGNTASALRIIETFLKKAGVAGTITTGAPGEQSFQLTGAMTLSELPDKLFAAGLIKNYDKGELQQQIAVDKHVNSAVGREKS